MTQESESKLARRVDDKRAEVPLNWSEASSTNAVPATDATASTQPAQREVPEYTGLDTLARVFAEAANGDGKIVLSAQSCDLLYRAMTTPLATPVAPAVQAPSQVPAELGDAVPEHLIDMIREYGDARADNNASGTSIANIILALRRHYGRAGSSDVRDQARIAELEAQLAECSALSQEWAAAAGEADGRAEKARAQALEEAAKACERQNSGDTTAYWNSAVEKCAYVIRALKAEAPSASKEGGE